MKQSLVKTQLLIIAAACMYAAGCNTDAVGNKSFEFYYYPSRNIYFDVLKKQYAYSIDGAATWQFYTTPTGKQPATLGNKQVIYSESEQPWTLNALHRKTYNGNLISLADAGDSLADETGTASEKKSIIKKPKLNVTPTQPDDQPEKKPGFFKRLFGRKHNN